jgi:hypothetical protein
MDKGIQEVIQVFCPICSRGVIVRNESMFRCKQCGRDVCRSCFDREERFCIECVGGRKPQDLRRSGEGHPPAVSRAKGTETAPEGSRRDARLVVAGLVVFAAGLSTSLLMAVPLWAGLVAAAAGIGMMARGLVGLLRM